MSDSPNQRGTRQAIEERLAQEFQDAKTAYDSATKQYQKTVRRCEDFRRLLQQKKQPFDSGLSVTEALKAHRDAFENVSGALKAMNKFVLYGELPDERNGDSARAWPKTEDSDVMTDAEFEDAYREALVSLADAGRNVVQPVGTDGDRVCVVDGKALRDYEVLELWWGKEITDTIRKQRRRK